MSAMLLGTSAFLRFVQPELGGFAEVDVRAQATWLALYLVAAVVLVARLLSRRPLALPDPYLCGFVLLALASTAWSANPEVTARRSLALLGTAVIGTLLASLWSFQSMLQLVRWVVVLAAVGSIAVTVSLLLTPSIASVEPYGQDAIRGVFFHKNGMGRVMAFGLLVVLLQGFLRRRVVRSDIVLAAMFIVLVALSRSATAMALVALTLVLLVALPLLRAPRLHMTLVGAGLVTTAAATALVGLAGMGFDDIVAMFGRDTSLTGRMGLWAAAADNVRDRAWLGHGFAGFWVADYQPAVLVAQRAHFPDVNQGHNGYIDVVLQLGVAGLAALGGSVAVTGRRIWRRLCSGEDRVAAAMAVLLVFIMASNLTESTFQQHSFFMMLLFAISASATSTAAAEALNRTPVIVPATAAVTDRA